MRAWVGCEEHPENASLAHPPNDRVTFNQPSYLHILSPCPTARSLGQGTQDIRKAAARTCSVAQQIALLFSFGAAHKPKQGTLGDPASRCRLLRGLVVVLGHCACQDRRSERRQ